MILADIANAVPASPASILLVGGLGIASSVSALVSIISVFATRREVETKFKAVDEDLVALEARVKAVQTEVDARLNRLLDSIDAVRVAMTTMERDMTAADERRAVMMHERINTLVTVVSEIRGELRANPPTPTRPK